MPAPLQLPRNNPRLDDRSCRAAVELHPCQSGAEDGLGGLSCWRAKDEPGRQIADAVAWRA